MDPPVEEQPPPAEVAPSEPVEQQLTPLSPMLQNPMFVKYVSMCMAFHFGIYPLVEEKLSLSEGSAVSDPVVYLDYDGIKLACEDKGDPEGYGQFFQVYPA